MERLKTMKENLISCVQSQICGNLDEVNTKELGEAIDMIKDLEEAIYYCTIVEAMEKKDDTRDRMYFDTYEKMPLDYYRDFDRKKYGKLYYEGTPYADNGMGRTNTSGSYKDFSNSYSMMRDKREGNSPYMRKMYMEAKELHKDNSEKMKDLEEYMKELTHDIIEMIEDATTDEKTLLKQKMSVLNSKVNNV